MHTAIWLNLETKWKYPYWNRFTNERKTFQEHKYIQTKMTCIFIEKRDGPVKKISSWKLKKKEEIRCNVISNFIFKFMGKAEMFVVILVWLYLCLYKCFKVESVKIILAVEKKKCHRCNKRRSERKKITTPWNGINITKAIILSLIFFL